MTDITGFETKAGGGEPTLGDLYSAFEEFKRTNDERLGELEKRGSTDAVTDDKLERLNRALDGYKSALDRAALDRARPVLDGGAPVGGDEYKQAFSAYVKRGEEKSLSVGTNADGGYVVPTEVETEITRRLTVLSPIRSIAGVRQVSASLYKKPVTVGGPAVGWVERGAQAGRARERRIGPGERQPPHRARGGLGRGALRWADGAAGQPAGGHPCRDDRHRDRRGRLAADHPAKWRRGASRVGRLDRVAHGALVFEQVLARRRGGEGRSPDGQGRAGQDDGAKGGYRDHATCHPDSPRRSFT